MPHGLVRVWDPRCSMEPMLWKPFLMMASKKSRKLDASTYVRCAPGVGREPLGSRKLTCCNVAGTPLALVLVKSGVVESVLPHGVHEFVVAGAKPLYATRRAMAMETGTPPVRSRY